MEDEKKRQRAEEERNRFFSFSHLPFLDARLSFFFPCCFLNYVFFPFSRSLLEGGGGNRVCVIQIKSSEFFLFFSFFLFWHRRAHEKNTRASFFSSFRFSLNQNTPRSMPRRCT